MTQNKDDLHNLLFSVRRSVRYHNRRRNFYDRFNLSSSALSLILGSATVYGLVKDSGGAQIALIAAALVTVLSALNLVIGSARQARLHHDLAKRFIALEKAMVKQQAPTESDLSAWLEERLDIEMDEPPVLHVLNALCHNELARAMGYSPEHYAHVAFYQRWLAPVLDIGEHRLKTG
ncbi:MAG: hypothetical protein ACXWT1_05800 [Methylobacter sp.]